MSEKMPRSAVSAEPVPDALPEEEFKQELTKLMPILYRHATKLAHRREDAEDLAQDTYKKALEAREHFHAETNLAAWLTTIMNHTHIDSKRLHANKMLRAEDPESDLEKLEVPGNQEATVDLKKAISFIDTLPPKQQEAMTLQAMGYEGEEAAEKMHIQLSTLKTHLAEAHKKVEEYKKENS